MDTKENEKSIFHSLQILRGFACWLVVFYHAYNLYGRFSLNGFGAYFFEGGSIGVHIFFVLSGFVIAGSINNKPSSFSSFISFIKKRFLRVAPPYYFWSFFFIIFYLKGSNYLSENRTVLFNDLLFIPGNERFPILPVGWTLNFEMFFYIAIALFFLLNLNRLFLLILLMLPLIGLSFKSGINYIDKILLSKLLWEFLAGILLYKYHETIKLSKSQSVLAVVTVAVGFLIFYYYNFFGNFYLEMTISALIVLSLVKLEAHFKVNNSFLGFLGNTSYSTYLCHIPILSYFALVFKYKFGWSDQLINGIWGDMVMLILIVLSSWLSYTFIERPFIKLSKSKFSILEFSSLKKRFKTT